ncbi:MAG: hypothetical protein AB8B53_10660 [Flavobacteriales bacterium]
MNSIEEKKRFLSELIRIMQLDGIETEEERLMISATLEYLDFSEVEYEILKEDPLEYNPPKSPFIRIVQFYQMAILVKADGKKKKREVLYLKWLALKMGLRGEAVDAILKRMGTQPTEVLSPEEVISIFQVFHN